MKQILLIALCTFNVNSALLCSSQESNPHVVDTAFKIFAASTAATLSLPACSTIIDLVAGPSSTPDQSSLNIIFPTGMATCTFCAVHSCLSGDTARANKYAACAALFLSAHIVQKRIHMMTNNKNSHPE